jgi:stress response protein YsnF
VQLRVSCRGSLTVARQKIHAGMIHAGKTAAVICENNHVQVMTDRETAVVVRRTTASEVHRYKANATDQRSSAANPDDLGTPADAEVSPLADPRRC